MDLCKLIKRYFSGLARLLRTQFSLTSVVANVTRVLPAMATQIGFGGAVESRMPRSYSETAARYVWANVSGIENKYVSLRLRALNKICALCCMLYCKTKLY